ncbi:uncharacterized protein LOC119674042 [Teleopsis dalmanni]|uniref:uncharacterized protein LOC119674042 n=1 Tax=Teleopsis dalmanni TaxID=139649 RepID=UPI0018CF2068|nr:uncharacterized protein LOC119674042 [Teleopsis dalmanni]
MGQIFPSLTSHGAKDNRNDELHRIINQNLIMSSSSVMPGSPLTSTGLISSSLSSSASDMPYPPSSISASSSQYQHTSGSSIKGFDSSNVIDEQQQKQEQHFSSRQLGRDTIAQRPTHKMLGVGNIGDGNAENQLDASGESADVFNSAPMYFGTENSTVVSTQIGATAHIPCTVHHIGDGVVSWIRKKDYHLLTVGLTTYSSDERFSATHLKHSEDWTLQIKFVQLRDAGVYECQVSTHPPTSIFLHLNVVGEYQCWMNAFT